MSSATSLEDLLIETLESYKRGSNERGDKFLKELTNSILKRFPENVYFLEKIMHSLSDIGQQEKASKFIENIDGLLEYKKKEIFSSKISSNEEDEMLKHLSNWHNEVENLRSLKRGKVAQIETMENEPSRYVPSRENEPSRYVPLGENEPKKPRPKEGSVLKEEQVRPSAHTTHDKWVTDDKLGYKVYAVGISAFLTHPQTKPPLTISIQAPWGGGKTSIMRMVQKELDPDGVDLTSDKPNQKHQEIPIKVKDIRSDLEKKTSKRKFEIKFWEKKPTMLTVWFNAWKYQNTEQLWAGLAHSIITQFSERLGPGDRERFLLELNLRRTNKDKIIHKINERVFSSWWRKVRKWCWTYLTGIGSSAIWFFIETTGAVDFITKPFGEIGMILFSLGGAVFIGIQRNEAAQAVNEEDADKVLGEFIQVPDYRANLGFIHHVDSDMQRVLSIIKENDKDLKLVVFIDDLDRCSPMKVAEVFEGINMFISAEYTNCFFVIGMDIELVAAALEKAHEAIIEKMPSYSRKTAIGWRFMDKFVQMPIIIPPPQKEKIEDYVNSLFTPFEENSKEIKIAEEIAQKIQTENNDDILHPEKFAEAVMDNMKRYDVKPEMNNLLINAVRQAMTHQEDMKHIENIKIGTEKYSDNNPEVREQVAKAVTEFSNNPREMKRFLNVLRFNYFMRNGRILSGLPAPSPDQVRRWIILTMKWPQVVLWLHRSSAGISFDKSSENETHKKLAVLEEHSQKSFEEWQTKLKDLLQIDSKDDGNNIAWVNDESLQRFFQDEEGILSTATETGLY